MKNGEAKREHVLDWMIKNKKFKKNERQQFSSLYNEGLKSR